MQLCGSLRILWYCLSLRLEWKPTFSNPCRISGENKSLKQILLRYTCMLIYSHHIHGVVPSLRNTGVNCCFLLQEIFPIHGLHLLLLHWQADSLPPSHLGNPEECMDLCKFSIIAILSQVLIIRWMQYVRYVVLTISLLLFFFVVFVFNFILFLNFT